MKFNVALLIINLSILHCSGKYHFINRGHSYVLHVHNYLAPHEWMVQSALVIYVRLYVYRSMPKAYNRAL